MVISVLLVFKDDSVSVSKHLLCRQILIWWGSSITTLPINSINLTVSPFTNFWKLTSLGQSPQAVHRETRASRSNITPQAITSTSYNSRTLSVNSVETDPRGGGGQGEARPLVMAARPCLPTDWARRRRGRASHDGALASWPHPHSPTPAICWLTPSATCPHLLLPSVGENIVWVVGLSNVLESL